MDSSTKIKRKQNPKERASLISNFFFLFAFKEIRKGVRREYVESDVYEIMKDYRSEKLGDLIQSNWNCELIKPNPSILRCLIKMFGFEYMLLGLAFFTYETTTLIVQPIFTGKLVSYFVPNTQVTQNEALMYATVILACIFLFPILDHTYFLLLQQVCLKVKISLSALVYRKCLKLNLNNSPQFASGMALTLISKDIMQFDLPIDCGHMFFNGSMEVIIMAILMYRKIGIASLVGTSFLFILIPTQAYLGYKTSAYRIRTSSFTDHRVRITQEILSAIRIIKMYTWELFFSKSVNEIRNKELKNLRVLFIIKAIATCVGELSSRIAFYLCVITYIALGNHITAENAFFITASFSAIEMLFDVYIPLGIGQVAELNASFKRLTSFLLLEEVASNSNLIKVEDKVPHIALEHVTIRSNENSNIFNDVNLEVRNGLTILTGYTGSGKSVLLKSLLGESKITQGFIKISGEISYASQEPWLFPGSIKQNIIFGENFDQERFEKVIEVCALKKDFHNLPNGDQTCLTDNGLNLSRGQKTRINLARSIYKTADIYLLDDCFSATDALVTMQIFNDCVKNFLKDKICVLVSNQDQLLEKADTIAVVGCGDVKFTGDYNGFKNWNREFKFITNFREDKGSNHSINRLEKNANSFEKDAGNPQIKNIYSEEKEVGSVNKQVYFKYLKQGGGIKMVILILIISTLTQVANSWADYFVSFWVDTEQVLSGFRFNGTTHAIAYKKSVESRNYIMIEYSLVILSAVVLTILTALAFYIFACKASINIHNLLINRILKAGMTFFDKNLLGNILNRFSRDLGIIDEQIPILIYAITTEFLAFLGTLFVVSSISIYFVVPSLIIAVLLIIAQVLYLPTGRSLKRLEGSTRSPIVGHLNATLEGLTTIRASKVQDHLLDEFDKHQNLHNSVSYMYMSTLRGFFFYLGILSFVYTSVIMFTFVFTKSEATAGEIGLAITQSFSVAYLFQNTLRNWLILELHMTSTERVIEYTKIKPENFNGFIPTDWPKQGKIVYNDVSLQYVSNDKPVLKNLSFDIEGTKKIGIVGRTGAGKSSLISSLFKLYDFDGKISVDDVDINNIDTTFLRSIISIIPQDPVLFSGTVRTNLDPYGNHTDKELWTALEEVKIKKFIKCLDSSISDDTCNFSIGQKQLFCLARALVLKNKILVLDEATANVDFNTDELIQNTIKKAFSNYTVITIAHRLNSVLHCDKVLVIDFGRVIEFDHPLILLNNKNGMFYKMAVNAEII